jgi:hypothetical protein
MHWISWLIHILIDFAIDHAKRRSIRLGTTLKRVECEQCHCGYEYEMHRKVTVRALRSQATVDHRAEAALRRKLKGDCDLVPCPECGWYQSHMLRFVRRRYCRSVPAASVFFVLLSAPFLACAAVRVYPGLGPGSEPEPWTAWSAPIGAVFMAIGLGLCLRRFVQAARYNPNCCAGAATISISQSFGWPEEEASRRSKKGNAVGSD